MNVRVVIEAEGSSEEVEHWLSRLGARPPSLAADLASVDQHWTTDVADRLVQRITTDARRALKFLMSNAPVVSFDDLQAHLGLDGIRTGGVMASFGFAENAGIPRPYRVDRPNRRYFVDQQAAPVVLEALKRYEATHGTVI